MIQKIKDENYPIRFLVYILGLFIMTLGISMSVKSDLGVSPVSSIPYFSNYLFSFLPTPHNILIRLILMFGSAAFIAVGIFFYLPADIVPLAGEGAMQAVSIKTHILFNKVKIGFDVSMVTISLIACLLTIGRLGSVGIGTVIAAVLVGTILGFVTRLFGAKRDAILYPQGKVPQ